MWVFIMVSGLILVILLAYVVSQYFTDLRYLRKLEREVKELTRTKRE